MAVPKTMTEELHPLAGIDRTVHAPARLMVMTYLYVVESAEFISLMHLTGLTWGNLSTHLSKLEEAGYIKISKEFRGKKPYTVAQLSPNGRTAFKEYKTRMQQVLGDLPD
jgi:DNA-binding MarR family transcriptional regulator